jgi:hypothetical protein
MDNSNPRNGRKLTFQFDETTNLDVAGESTTDPTAYTVQVGTE